MAIHQDNNKLFYRVENVNHCKTIGDPFEEAKKDSINNIAVLTDARTVMKYV